MATTKAMLREKHFAVPVRLICASRRKVGLHLLRNAKFRKARKQFTNRLISFSDILDKTLPVLQSHPRYMKTVGPGNDGEWRITVRSRDDEARLIHVHVFL